MKWIIILLLFFVFFVLVVTRFRKQINAAIVLWRSLQSQSEQRPATRRDFENNIKSVPLIKCAKCGSWTPESNSLMLNSLESYCSKPCIEAAIETKKNNAVL